MGGWYYYEIPIGCQVKHVKCVDDGYLFTCKLGSSWVEMHTKSDLPAFTDKGNTHRAQRPTLTRGRPRRAVDGATRRLVLRATPEQYAWVEQRANADETTVTEVLRTLLISSGMPQ